MRKRRKSTTEIGSKYERHVAKAMRWKGFCFVKVCGKSGDKGADILARKLPFFRKTVVQCKCYSGKVGPSAVQEAFTAKQIFKAGIAVVATNSMLTKEAKDMAKKCNVKVWEGF